MMKGGALVIAFMATAMAVNHALPVASNDSDPPCPVCVTLDLVLAGQVANFFTTALTPAQCKKWQEQVIAEITEQAAAVGAGLLPDAPTITCTDNKLEVCLTLASSEEGARLQELISQRLLTWYTGFIPCKPYYRWPYGIRASVSNGIDDTGCINGRWEVTCEDTEIPFPACICHKARGATPFYALPVLEVAPGRTNSTSLYCFKIITSDPLDVMGAFSASVAGCGQSTTLLKAEVYADDTQRRRVKALAVQPAGATSLRYVPASWGRTGENTLKFTSLNWSKEQANGAKLCMEVDDSYGIVPLCFSSTSESCSIALYSPTRECCPTFKSST